MTPNIWPGGSPMHPEETQMHTTETKHTIFHHNGDFDGDVVIVDKRAGCKELGSIPFDDIKALVAEWARSEQIARIEQQKADDLLIG